MRLRARAITGFTLIEMMITFAVMVVLLLIAIPSFQAYRQRAALRAASEEVLGIFNQARLEAAKRNTWVKFARQASGGDHCVGIDVAASAADTTACDCFETSAADADYCDIARWPATGSDDDQAEWRGVTLGAPTAATSLATVVIEPKRAFLTPASTAGAIAFTGPPGPYAYRLYLRIDDLGRGVLCEPTDASKKMSDYANRGCTP